MKIFEEYLIKALNLEKPHLESTEYIEFTSKLSEMIERDRLKVSEETNKTEKDGNK